MILTTYITSEENTTEEGSNEETNGETKADNYSD